MVKLNLKRRVLKMSMENVKKFYEMLKANEGLTQEVTKLKEELVNGDKKFLKDGYVINKKIIPLAQKYGLDFTEEEFASYTRGQTFALSEGELLNISGGVGVFGALGRVFFSIVNFLNPFGAREDLMDGAPPQQIMVDRQKIVTSNNLNKENNAKRLIELEKEVSGFENGNIRSMLSDQDYETFMDLIGLRYPRCFESLQERIGEDFHKISMEESNAKGKIIKQEQKKNETLQQKVENLNKTIDEQNEKLASLSENESSKEAKIKELNKKIVKNEILNKELAQNRSIYGNKNYKAFSKKDYLGNQVNKLVQFLNKINYNLENVSASSIEELRADIIYVGRQMMGEKENRYLKGKYYSYTATDANLEQEDLEALYNLYQQVKNNN